jgi:hypothetical protein
MRRAPRSILLVAVAVAVAGCGGGGSKTAGPTATGPRPTQPIATSVACLKKAGFRAGGGPAGKAGGGNAPDAELVASKGGAFPRGTALFAGYYKTAARAEILAPSIRANAKRIHGLVERYGRVSFIWTRAPTSDIRSDVERCVFR